MAHLAITPQNLEQERGIVMEERRLRIDDQVSGVDERDALPARLRAEPLPLEHDRLHVRPAAHHARPGACLLPHLLRAQQRHRRARRRRRAGGGVRARAQVLRRAFRGGAARAGRSERAAAGRRAAGAGREDGRAAGAPDRLQERGGARTPIGPPSTSSRSCSAAATARACDEDLLREHEIATEVEASNNWGIDPELFSIYAQARPRKTAADLEARHRCGRRQARDASPCPPTSCRRRRTSSRRTSCAA